MSQTARVEAKARLRRQLQAARAALSPALRRDFSERIRARVLAIPEVRHGATVFCFISHGTEADTHALLDALLRDGKTIVVPHVLPEHRMIAVRFGGWTDLRPGTLGIPTPTRAVEFSGDIDVCITPGIGFSVCGQRLGHGRGYYDQWFAGHAVRCKVAVAFECQLLAALPVNAHDVPVDAIATEQRLIRTVQPAAPD